MRQQTISLYTFSELTEEAKEKAIQDYRESPYIDEFALQEGIKSLKAYCEHFGVELEDYSIGAFHRSYAKTDASNAHFRGLKLKDCDPDLMPTGYFIDQDFFLAFYDNFKRTGDALGAFNHGLELGIDAIINDAEHCYSDEYIIDMIEANEYEFLPTGEIYS